MIPSISFRHGGPSRAMATIESALRERVSVTTLTTDDDGPGRRFGRAQIRELENEGARVLAHKWFDAYKIAPDVVPWLWRNVAQFDAVHIHALFSFTSSAAAWAARMKGVPYIVRPLGTLNSYGMSARRPVLKRLFMAVIDGPILRNAAAVHFTSKSEQEQAEALGCPSRGVVIPLGVEDQFDTGSNAGVRGPQGATASRILFLSRLDPKKSLPVLLRALSLLRDGIPQVRLTIAGDGPAPFVAGLRALADELGVSRNVDWVGHIDGPHKQQALAEADLFVLPSVSENFGIAAVEAMMAGLPCILSPGVAIAGAAAADHAAEVCQAEPAALSDAIHRLLQSPELREQMSRRARAHALAHYSTDAMADRLVALYREMSKSALRSAS